MNSHREQSDMLKRWFHVLLDYDFDIVHRPGVDNTLPDLISRLFPSFQDAPDPEPEAAWPAAWDIPTTASSAETKLPSAYSNDWKLHPLLYKLAAKRWGPFSIDLLTSKYNLDLLSRTHCHIKVQMCISKKAPKYLYK